MELTHSKGLMYPALKLSSFRVRRDSLPSAFELPGEIGRAASEPLPELRSTAFEEKALQESLKLLEEDENERAATRAAIAEEEAAAMRCEANRLAEENAKASEPDGTGENVVVVRRLCDMGFPEASVRSALVSNDWDETAAINVLLSG